MAAAPILSIALSWVSGFVLMRLVIPGRSDAHFAIHAGYGFFAGMALTVLTLAVFRELGLGMSWFGVAGVLFLASIAGWYAGRRAVTGRFPISGLRHWMSVAPRWESFVFLALIAWVLLHALLVGVEAALRPLYAWDGWMHWSPKARVWIETGQWFEFVSRQAWLSDAGRGTYTIRNWSYPEFVPLVQTWILMPLGRWDAVQFGYPWIALFGALPLAAYGTARFTGSSPLAAILTAWLLVSLPFLHVHAALPGYADLWLGAYLGLAAGSLMIAAACRQRRWLLLSLAFGLLCAWIKVPGAGWLLVILGGLLAYLLPPRLVGMAMVGFVAAVAVVLFVGVDVGVPGLGRVAISTNGFDLPVIGQHEWQFNPVFGVMLGHLTFGANWHFLWPLGVILYAISIPAATRDSAARSAWVLMLLGALFLFSAFMLTSRGADIAETQMTHRAFLPLAILVIMTFPTLLLALLRPSGVPEEPSRKESTS